MIKITNNINSGNLSDENYRHWTLHNTTFMAVKLDGYVNSSVNASGKIKLTGISGSVEKDKEIVSDWIVFVLENGKVSTLNSWEHKDAINYLVKSMNGPVNVLFKDQSENQSS